ncbi:RibD family protein [Humibacillus xanthopallidus]|nr:RibD family protein [Humibacillus xanthopallidus]
MTRPHVVVYNEVSIDGRVVGFDTDPSRYYRLGFRWRSGAILMGSTTALAFGPPEPVAEELRALPPPDRLPVVPGFESLVTEPRPLLVVSDSQGIVRCWQHALAQPWYRSIVVLVSRSTPADYRRYLDRRGIEHLEAGEHRVDLARALERLATTHGVSAVRTDGGGALNGALLTAGLVDEIALLLDPVISSDPDGQRLVTLPHPTAPGGIRLRLTDVERLDDGALLLRYATNPRAGPPTG